MLFEKRQLDVQIGHPNQSLSIDDLLEIVRSGAEIKYSSLGLQQIDSAREKIQKMLNSGQVVYGVTSGFGNNAHIMVPAEYSEALNNNLITSHAATYGPDMPQETVKLMILMRLQGFGKGLSGVRKETIERVVDLYNAGIIPKVEKLGSVGASGDLEPLSTIFGAYFHGVGELWDPITKTYEPAAEVLENYKFGTYNLAAKEGLGLNNGPQQIMAYAAEAIERTENALKVASVVFSMGLTGYMAHKNAYDRSVDHAYPVESVVDFNAVMRGLLRVTEKGADGNLLELSEWHTKPQSNYCWRAGSVTLGDSIHILNQAKKTVTEVINSVTDNPLIFDGKAISSALFHGQVLGNRLDQISAQIEATNHLLAQATQRLLEGSRELPGYLIKDGGLNNGFMMTERNVAGNAINTTSINYSSKNLPTGSQEDYVSMANFSAFQLDDFSKVLEHQVALFAITAVQSIHIRLEQKANAPEAIKGIEGKIAQYNALKGSLDEKEIERNVKELESSKKFHENVLKFTIPDRLKNVYAEISKIFPYMEKDTAERPLKDEYKKVQQYLFAPENVEKLTALFDECRNTSRTFTEKAAAEKTNDLFTARVVGK